MAKPELIRRNQALQKTQARFAGKEFKLGSNDCVKLARFHLRAMGHRKIPPTGNYSTAKEGVRQLKKTGHRNLESLLDSLLERIAPASMLPGDIALVQAEPDAPASQLGTIVVSVGRKFLGWHPDQLGFAVIEPIVERPFTAAWRA